MHRQGDKRQQRMVMHLLVQLRLRLANCFRIAEMLDFNAVKLRHELHHDNAVFLTPKRQRQQDDFYEHREQRNGKPPVLRQGIARLHEKHERVCYGFHHGQCNPFKRAGQ